MPKVVLAAIQHPPVFLNARESVGRAVQLVEEAANKGANMVSFGECWVPGYPTWLDHAPRAALWDEPGAKQLFRLLADQALSLNDPMIAALQDCADRTGVHMVMGIHERAGGTLYNTLVHFSPGLSRLFIHRKLTPTYTERLVWGQGDGSTLDTVGTNFGPVGGLICWEHWMPLARAAMHAQQEVVHAAQWPGVVEAHQLASRHYAFEGRCFVIAAGTILSKADVLEGFDQLKADAPAARDMLESMVGDGDHLYQRGGSSIIGPDGSYLVDPVYDQAGIVLAEADLDLLAESRLTLDTAGHYSRPDVFELRVDRRPKTGVIFDDVHPDLGSGLED